MSQRTEFKVDRDWTGALSLKQDSRKWQQAYPRNWPSNPHQAREVWTFASFSKKYRPKPCKAIHVWNLKPIQPPRIPRRVKKKKAQLPMVRLLQHIKTAIKGPRFVGIRMNQAPFVLPVKKDIPEILNRRNLKLQLRSDQGDLFFFCRKGWQITRRVVYGLW